jgi:calmodulin
MEQYGEKMSDAELDLLFRETDKNGDGHVDFNDFIQMMMSK